MPRGNPNPPPIPRLNPQVLQAARPYFGTDPNAAYVIQPEMPTVVTRIPFWECEAQYNPLGRFAASFSRYLWHVNVPDSEFGCACNGLAHRLGSWAAISGDPRVAPQVRIRSENARSRRFFPPVSGDSCQVATWSSFACGKESGSRGAAGARWESGERPGTTQASRGPVVGGCRGSVAVP
jgi:hypothetical protein